MLGNCKSLIADKKVSIFIRILLMGSLFFSCRIDSDKSKVDIEQFVNMQEVQLTSGEKGHFLNNTQFFSPDDEWIVYDTRNDGTEIGKTCCIEAVNINTGEIKPLYTTEGQTEFGPGVGAVTSSPVTNKVLFIHGLQNCDLVRPYDLSRRSGVAVDMHNPGKPVFMDARDVTIPFTPGALRGGTHAHSWSSDGEWISFTYNDALMFQLEKDDMPHKRDLRMVGVMAPYGPVGVEHEDMGENFGGTMFSVVVSKVTEEPEPGSNQIDRAYEDGWVGERGYLKENGVRQERAIAFLGDTRDLNGNKLTEVFIVDIPDDMTREIPGQPLAGTLYSRPNPPEGVQQRRLTFTNNREYPGVQGPRHWLRSTPDGSLILFLMKDDQGFVQIYGISPLGGEVKQITFNNFPIETTFSISPDGEFLAYGNGQRVYVTNIQSSETKAVSPSPQQGMTDLQSICWSNNGKMLAWNRKVEADGKGFFQVFILK